MHTPAVVWGSHTNCDLQKNLRDPFENVSGSVLVSDLMEAQDQPRRIGGPPFSSFKDLKTRLSARLLQQKDGVVNLSRAENLIIEDLQFQVDRFQAKRRCCGLLSFEEWANLTVSDQQRVRFLTDSGSLASIWWEECHRKKFKCLFPVSCCRQNEKGHHEKRCNEVRSSSESQAQAIGCKAATASFLRWYIVALLIMIASKFLLNFIGFCFIMITVGKEQMELDKYHADAKLKDLQADLQNVNQCSPIQE